MELIEQVINRQNMMRALTKDFSLASAPTKTPDKRY